MFNPYVMDVSGALEPAPARHGKDPLRGMMDRLGRMDSDDLLLMLIIYLLVKDGNSDSIWPMIAALIYLML